MIGPALALGRVPLASATLPVASRKAVAEDIRLHSPEPGSRGIRTADPTWQGASFETTGCRDWAAAITALIANNRWNGCEMIKTFSGALSQQQNPNRLEPTRKPRLDLLEKDEVKAKRPSMWNIVFYNDDYTTMDFVVFVLTKVFHRSTEDALALTMAVHTQGKGIAGTYTFEVAEQKQCEVLLMAKIEEHPLRVEVEKA